MINKYRKKINRIDSEIIRLLGERKTVCLKIGEHKKDNGDNIFDKQREEEISMKLKQRAEIEGLDEKYIKKVFEVIIGDSKRIQAELKNG